MNSNSSDNISISSENSSFSSFDDIFNANDQSSSVLLDIDIEREIDNDDDSNKSFSNAPKTQIFVGMSQKSKQHVLIKKIRLSTDKYNEFETEQKFFSKFQHPNIIKFIASFADDDYGYIIEEYAEGNDLFYFLNQYPDGCIPQKVLIHIIYQLLLLIEWMQDNKFTHNDIKLENIVIDTENLFETLSDMNEFRKSIKLIDFGSARMIDDKYMRLKSTNMPPEYVNDNIVDFSYDIWSLGEMIYLIVTGEKYFDYNGSEYAVKDGCFKEPYWSAYSNSLKRLVKEMLTYDYEIRPSASDLLKKYFK